MSARQGGEGGGLGAPPPGSPPRPGGSGDIVDGTPPPPLATKDIDSLLPGGCLTSAVIHEFFR